MCVREYVCVCLSVCLSVTLVEYQERMTVSQINLKNQQTTIKHASVDSVCVVPLPNV